MTWNELATEIKKMPKEGRKSPVKVTYPNGDNSRVEPVVSEQVSWGDGGYELDAAGAFLSVDPPC